MSRSSILFSFLCAGFAIATSPSPVGADIYDEAAQILSGGAENSVRRWVSPPSILVIEQSPVDRDVLSSTIEMISIATRMTPSEVRFMTLPEGELPQRFYDFTTVSQRRSRLTGDHFYTVGPRWDHSPSHSASRVMTHMFGLPFTSWEAADVLLIHVEPAAAELLYVGMRGRPEPDSRDAGVLGRFVRGERACFEFSIEYGGPIEVAAIFINPDREPAIHGQCLYESLVAIMGLGLNASGSENFNFNGNLTPLKEDFDMLLLRALYDPLIEPHDPIRDVLYIFDILLDAKD